MELGKFLPSTSPALSLPFPELPLPTPENLSDANLILLPSHPVIKYKSPTQVDTQLEGIQFGGPSESQHPAHTKSVGVPHLSTRHVSRPFILI